MSKKDNDSAIFELQDSIQIVHRLRQNGESATSSVNGIRNMKPAAKPSAKPAPQPQNKPKTDD